MTAHLNAFALSAAIVLSAVPQTGANPPTTSPPKSNARPAAQAATARPGSLVLTVVSEAGAPVGDAVVTVTGAADRRGVSGADGIVTLQNLSAGT